MKKTMVILWEMLLESIASVVTAIPLSPSKMIRIAKEFLFVLKYALSFAIFLCVLVLVILAIPYSLSSIESPGSISYILWIVGYIGFFIGWVIGWQRLKDKDLYRIRKKVYRK